MVLTTITVANSLGGWDYPGCTRAEATCEGQSEAESHTLALALVDHLRASDPAWANAVFRLVTVGADGIITMSRA